MNMGPRLTRRSSIFEWASEIGRKSLEGVDI